MTTRARGAWLVPLVLAVALSAPSVRAAEPAGVRVTGVVRHAGTLRVVVGAEVALLPELDDIEASAAAGGPSGADPAEAHAVAFTDAEGRFAFLVPPGRYVLDVRVSGYDPHSSTETLVAGEDVDLAVALYPERANVFESVVRGQTDDGAVSRVTLRRDELVGTAGTMGDALRVVESLPGTARIPLLGGGLVVRGGQPGTTSIYFDGVPIPALYHFGGFTSVVNASLLESIDFEAGGFGVEYGRAIAGIVDVKSRDLRFETFTGAFDIDMQDVGFFLAGPVDVGWLPKLNVAVAARRSYLELPGSALLWGARAMGAPLPFVPIPAYSDMQAAIEVRPLARNRIKLLIFGAEDHWQLLGEDFLDVVEEAAGQTGSSFLPTDGLFDERLLDQYLSSSFWRAVAEWELRPVPGVKNTLRPFVGTTKTSILSRGAVTQTFAGLPIVPPEAGIDWGLRDELAVALAPWLRFKAGLDHVGRTLGMALDEPLVREDACTPRLEDEGACAPAYPRAFNLDGTFTSTALYAEAALGPVLGVSLFPGVRADVSTLRFAEAAGRIRYLDGRGPQTTSWWSIEPRLAGRYQPLSVLAMKGAVGLYRQPPRMEAALLNTARDLEAPLAVQAVGGVEMKATRHLTVDAQVYGIRRHLLERDESRAFGQPVPELPVFLAQPGVFDSQGQGQTLGFEVLLRHQPSRWFFGWVSYTFSRTWLDVGEELDRFHPAPFDSTHNLVAVGKLNLWWGITVGGRFQYATGAPGPIHDSVTVLHNYQTGTFTPVKSTLRRPRLPDYHRLDVRLDKRWTFDAFSVVTHAEVMNVYAYPNIEIAIPGNDFRGRSIQPLLMGVPLFPSAGMAVEF